MAHLNTTVDFGNVESIDLSEADSILFFSFYAASLLFVSLLFTLHSYKVISDLCTKSRVSVSHRRLPPPLTPKYKSINLFAHLFLFLSLIYLLVCTVQMSDSNYSDCVITTYIWTYAWLLSKACMYAVFLLRLDMVYARSAYGYNKIFIYCMISFVIFSSLALSTILIFSINDSVFLTTSHESVFPNPCFVYYPFWGYASFLIYDFISNIACLILFIIPLYRAIKKMGGTATSPANLNSKRKMIYVGVKCLILTSTCVITTVITLSLLSFGYFGWMCAVDVCINCICVLLMTPYYKNSFYYERLCWICLYKCPNEYRNSRIINMPSSTRLADMQQSECKGLTTEDEGKE